MKPKHKNKSTRLEPQAQNYFPGDLITIINTAFSLILILSVYEAVAVVIGYDSIENNFRNLCYSFNYAFKNNLWLVLALLILNVVWLALITPILKDKKSGNIVCQLVKGLPLLGLVLKYARDYLINMGLPGAAFIFRGDPNIRLKSLAGVISVCVIVVAYVVLFKFFSLSKKNKHPYSIKARLSSLLPVLATTLVLFFSIEYVEANYKSNVLLLVVDTLRADHLGCYGYPRGTSPNLDKFAEHGIRFKNAFANASATIVSSPTIYASIYPSQHKLKSYNDFLDLSFVTMAEVLQTAGYKTLGIVANPHLTNYNGFNQGFETYYSDLQWDHAKNIAANLNKKFLDWLGYRDKKDKFFALLFYVDPHVPFEAPPPFDTKFNHYVETKATVSGKDLTKKQKQQIADYDAEIYYFDYQFGKLVDELKKMGVYDDTLIILTSDHGEEFWEHGRFGHGQSLYSELINIPIIMKLPSALIYDHLKHKEAQQNMPVSNVDILPTTLALLNIPADKTAQRQFVGKNIFDNLNRSRQEPQFVFLEQILTQYGPYVLQGISTNEWKYVVTYKDGDKPAVSFPTFELYNIKNDPAETKNLIKQRPDMANKLKGLLNKQVREMEIKSFTPQRVEPNKIIRERLKSLGYIN